MCQNSHSGCRFMVQFVVQFTHFHFQVENDVFWVSSMLCKYLEPSPPGAIKVCLAHRLRSQLTGTNWRSTTCTYGFVNECLTKKFGYLCSLTKLNKFLNFSTGIKEHLHMTTYIFRPFLTYQIFFGPWRLEVGSIFLTLQHTAGWNTIFSHIYLLVRYISLKF